MNIYDKRFAPRPLASMRTITAPDALYEQEVRRTAIALEFSSMQPRNVPVWRPGFAAVGIGLGFAAILAWGVWVLWSAA